MRRLIQLIRRIWSMASLSPKFFTKRQAMRFWHTHKKGHTVSVITYSDGNMLEIMFQRPLKLSDRGKDGKLATVTKSVIKPRGGKRQTSLLLELEGAKALYKVLGAAIENAEEKQEQIERDRTISHMVTAMTMEK